VTVYVDSESVVKCANGNYDCRVSVVNSTRTLDEIIKLIAGYIDAMSFIGLIAVECIDLRTNEIVLNGEYWTLTDVASWINDSLDA
jgi:polynucleotide 5'-kinase involved in rRNA processing